MPELTIFKIALKDIHCIPPRQVLDNAFYGYGEALINFVKDCKLCILTGRLDPQNNHFTYISNKGKSVVDYIITPTRWL